MIDKLINNKFTIVLSLVSLAVGYVTGSGMIWKNIGDMDHSKMTNEEMSSMSNVSDIHAHKHVAVPNGFKSPTVKVMTSPDSMGGYNIQILTTNFKFTPEDAGKAVVPNTGHAHVFVNDEKIGRAYGDWYYIGKDKFKTGTNTISVSLNANEHSDWVLQDGETEVSAKVEVVVD